MSLLAIIRHGRTGAAEDKGIYDDVGDPDSLGLDQHGKWQARRLGRMLRDVNFAPSAVFTSPSARCLQTADFLVRSAVRREMHISACPELAAQDWGRLPFSGRRELMAKWSYPAGILNSCFPGGESGWSVLNRSSRFVDRIGSVVGADAVNLVIVSHGIVVKCILGKLLGWTFDEIECANSVPHGCGMILDVDNGKRARCLMGIWNPVLKGCRNRSVVQKNKVIRRENFGDMIDRRSYQ